MIKRPKKPLFTLYPNNIRLRHIRAVYGANKRIREVKKMKNDIRNQKEEEILDQIRFCKSLFDRLQDDFLDSIAKTDANIYEDSVCVKNHTRFAEDTRRIRRELLKVSKLFEKAGW